MTRAIDVERARRDTPGCAHVVHLNNAGCALPPGCVLDAVIEHLRLEARLGGYEAADAARTRIERTYQAIATLLGCSPDEIALVENATRAWDMAFYALRFAPGDRILTARAEYASNAIALLQVAARTGARVEFVPDDAGGQLDVDALERMLDDRVKLVAVTHVPSHGGLVNPAEAIGRLTRAAGVPFLLDACQSVGQMPVDVGRIGCDMLSATGRKFLRGPRGTGFLYVRRDLIARLEPPFLDLHAASWTAPDRYEVRADARRFETWESNVAGTIGLGVAVDHALGWGLEPIRQRVVHLADRLRAMLADLPGITVQDRGETRCGIVTFSATDRDATTVAAALRAQAINVSVSPVSYAVMDLGARGVPDLVRASVHYYNTEEELDRLREALMR
ncbi:MAG TPA: aminotransferase class V-fold PLP-dependent enzyme [Kofleriaceae bacterium]|nr:aminotransferase class V-fold PLP-dependent enzyme [Kofleriaceae bacterium]